MIRILLYGSDRSCRTRLRVAVDAFLTESGSCNHGFSRAMAPSELVSTARRFHPSFYDLIVCCISSDEEADEVFVALDALRELGYTAEIVIVSHSPDLVGRALSVGASGFTVKCDGVDGLRRTLSPVAERIIEAHSKTIGLRDETGVGNVRTDDILFAESSKKGSIVHMADGTTRLVRTTLQALFSRLEGAGDFVKAGSSFIVNLANVRLADDGAVVFASGDSIIVPVRVRKPFSENLASYWRGGVMAYTAPVSQ